MNNSMPILLIPGLGGSPRIYAPVIPQLWRHGPVTVANHLRDDSIGAIARRILAEAPPRFALAGHSMGGYIALEIMRQAPERVAKLALLNTQARPDSDEAKERRRRQIEAIKAGSYSEAAAALYPGLVHPSRHGDAELLAVVETTAEDVGPEAFTRQLVAIMGRSDSRATLAKITCPTLVLTGDQDNTIPNVLSVELADGIAGAKLVTLADCGHLPQLERPRETTAALLDWLRI
ncbi:alpha/beta fold hydrolase [Rhodopseudomonas palustris]|uniref:Alpha/beta hydrolase fold n=1 Tax=Rhodopseudomonas palustris (strain BisB18) TaxID=316056 RepID=Q21AQ5_RHOPB